MKKEIKKTLFILFLIAINLTSCKDSGMKKYIPKNLNKALIQIDFNVSDSLKLEIKKKTEDDFTNESHFGLGMKMRNNWNLWKGSNL